MSDSKASNLGNSWAMHLLQPPCFSTNPFGHFVSKILEALSRSSVTSSPLVVEEETIRMRESTKHVRLALNCRRLGRGGFISWTDPRSLKLLIFQEWSPSYITAHLAISESYRLQFPHKFYASSHNAIVSEGGLQIRILLNWQQLKS